MAAEYKCDRCGFVTIHKFSIMKHLRKTLICDALLLDISRDKIIEKIEIDSLKKDQKFKCKFCPKTLTTRNGIYLHQTKCKYKDNPYQNNIDINANTTTATNATTPTNTNTTTVTATNTNNALLNIDNIEETDFYQKLLLKLKNDLTFDKINIGTQNNAQNIIQFTTNNMYSFGNEKIDYISKDKDLLGNCFINRDIPEIVKQIHFSQEYPNNGNIRLKNNDEKSNFIEVYSEGSAAVDNFLSFIVFFSFFMILS